MLYTKIQLQSFLGSGEEDFFSIFTIYRHGGHLDLQALTICTNFQSPFNRRLHMKFEEICPRGFKGEVVQRRSCSKVFTDDGRTGDGWRVITIAHPEPK